MALSRAVRSAVRLARALEARAELADVGHDEARGGGRRRRAHVGGEVAERGVLLVADRRDDRDGARSDGADDALVGERQQILEAASAAREDDHVGATRGEVPDRSGDRSAARGPWT